MRLWHFDRLGAVASESFDIHINPWKFVCVILGFLWMPEKELGFDPIIIGPKGKKHIEITLDDKQRCLHLDHILMRQRCLAGRASICWKAYVDGGQSAYVVKDSWEDENRPEEGLLLQKMTKSNVKNITMYYYHEEVYYEDTIDDILNNVRKGLAKDGQSAFDLPDSDLPTSEHSAEIFNKAGRKRNRESSKTLTVSSQRNSTNAPKRACLNPSTRKKETPQQQNRIHRRLIMSRAGKRLYEASSMISMIIGVLGGIKGHESLLDEQVLHRDISDGSILLEEDESDGFLIDLDLAIEIDRKKATGASTKTGTKLFMAIGVLYGENHYYMHDLEPFFWVLFWICIHCTSPGKDRRTGFEEWNYANPESLAVIKAGTVVEESRFIQRIEGNFTKNCRPLSPCVLELRRVVFPDGKRHEIENRDLYSETKSVLEMARDKLIADAKS